jgi:hypothetical protein
MTSLRAKTNELKKRSADYVAEDRAKVDELRKGIEEAKSWKNVKLSGQK